MIELENIPHIGEISNHGLYPVSYTHLDVYKRQAGSMGGADVELTARNRR